MALRLSQALICAGLLFWGQAGVCSSTTVSVEDDMDREVLLERPAQRIIALAPHLTELMFAIGAGDRLVGAVEYSDYPEAAKSIPRVGGYASLDYERLLALKPDLVLVWATGSGAPAIKQLERLGLTLYLSEPRALEDVATSLERLGTLVGHEKQAKEVADDFRKRRDELKARFANTAPVSVFYQIWHQPLMTVNGDHLISQVLGLCGGRNVFADLSALAPQLDVESVLQADPEVIIAGGKAGRPPQWLLNWKRWPQMRAVKAGHLYAVNSDHLHRHTPRILLGAEQVCMRLDAVREAR